MIHKRPDHKLSENQVRLFLLKKLREARRKLREYKKRDWEDPQVVALLGGRELEATSCYQEFCESLDENWLIPVLDGREGHKRAKTLYGDHK